MEAVKSLYRDSILFDKSCLRQLGGHGCPIFSQFTSKAIKLVRCILLQFSKTVWLCKVF